jgi:hypothetical protein
MAQLLHDQHSNPFRVRAYHHAAETLEQLDRPVNEILMEKGIDGLKKLPGIGERLATSIRTLILTGRLPLLDHLRGDTEPVALLASIPGIGKRLATRLHEELDIDTLEELEMAAYDGRLSTLTGMGYKRRAGIVANLHARLGRVHSCHSSTKDTTPPIEELLDVDREYRSKAAADQLHKVAPRRLNPSGEAWLPILHTQRGGHHYTALFSNTARAHQLGTTHDWVVVYQQHGTGEWQGTIITATWGDLKGYRIVRGRERECLAYYGVSSHDLPLKERDATHTLEGLGRS